MKRDAYNSSIGNFDSLADVGFVCTTDRLDNYLVRCTRHLNCLLSPTLKCAIHVFMLGASELMHRNGGYVTRMDLGVFITLIVWVVFKYGQHVLCSHFRSVSVPLIDRHLVFSFFYFYRSFSAQVRYLVCHQLSLLFLLEILLIFVLKRQKAPLVKAVMTSASPAARPVIGELIVPTRTSLPDQPTNSSKVCQVKTAALLGSSNSISDHKVVKETLKGISDDDPVFEERFEFESSQNSIQSVKGSLRAHFSFWLHTLGAKDFILRIIDKGYAIPFIAAPQNAFFDNNHSGVIHADFVFEAIQELLSVLLSGSVVEVPSPPHVVNPLSTS